MNQFFSLLAFQLRNVLLCFCIIQSARELPPTDPHTQTLTHMEQLTISQTTSPTHSAQASSGWERRRSRRKTASDSKPPGTTVVQTASPPPLHHFPKREEPCRWSRKVPLYKTVFAGPAEIKTERQRAEIYFLGPEICCGTTETFICVH